MELKGYQQNCLAVLKRFCEAARKMPLKYAYASIVAEPDIGYRLGKLGGFYDDHQTPGIPRVCLKVPTGGGKTILAAYSLKIVAETIQGKQYPFALWFVPSEAIRSQTADALKNTRHPYRIALDDQFNGCVKVLDLDDKFTIKPEDIQNNACIVVSTIQAFRQSSTDKYNVYKKNESILDYYGDFPKTDGLMLDDKGKPIASFVNLLHLVRPVMIVDEAHNAVTELSSEMQQRINPSAVIEFTATPQVANNTLYLVRASELKDAQMIKLPIMLKENSHWEVAVTEALARRGDLQSEAEKETEYVRPVILFQAQAKDEEITVAKLKEHLMIVHDIPEQEIAIATGEQRELDGVNVFDAKCPVKYIITVEALKEGWDCSFAYVLCSLANISSNTSIEQLLGRVMRMPYAKKRKSAALNKAYAFVMSKHFGTAAADIIKKLEKKGFEDDEARASVQEIPNEDLFGHRAPDRVYLTQKIEAVYLPPGFKLIKEEDGTSSLAFGSHVKSSDIESVIKLTKMPPKAAYELRWKHSNIVRNNLPPAPCRQMTMKLPRMLAEVQGELCLAEFSALMDAAGMWSFDAFVSPQIDPAEFLYSDARNSSIDLKNGGLTITDIDNQPTLFNTGETHWTKETLISDLCRLIRPPDVRQVTVLTWLGLVVDYLLNDRQIPLRQLMVSKFTLRDQLLLKIEAGRERFRENFYQLAFFSETAKIAMDFRTDFEFVEGMYDDQLFDPVGYEFTKHFLGADKVGKMDTAEELACARELNRLEEIECWIRNIAKHPKSYRLPTAKDNFYPDFVCRLKDGRMLVVEYKGDHLRAPAETDNRIGKAMEQASGGKCLFLMVFKNENGLDMRAQLKKKINA